MINSSHSLIDSSFTYAVVGASKDRSKWGYRILKSLVGYGYTVVGVNPKYDDIDGIPCLPSIRDLINDLRFKNNIHNIVVVTVTPANITKQIVEECLTYSIRFIWMQPGSEVDLTDESKLSVVRHACIIRDGLGKPFLV